MKTYRSVCPPRQLSIATRKYTAMTLEIPATGERLEARLVEDAFKPLGLAIGKRGVCRTCSTTSSASDGGLWNVLQPNERSSSRTGSL